MFIYFYLKHNKNLLIEKHLQKFYPFWKLLIVFYYFIKKIKHISYVYNNNDFTNIGLIDVYYLLCYLFLMIMIMMFTIMMMMIMMMSLLLNKNYIQIYNHNKLNLSVI